MVVNGLIGSTCISVFVDTSDHGLSQSLKGPRVVTNGLIGMSNALVKCLFILTYF
jgi:hypothetical protein